MNVNAAADVNAPDLQHDEFALVFTHSSVIIAVQISSVPEIVLTILGTQ